MVIKESNRRIIVSFWSSSLVTRIRCFITDAVLLFPSPTCTSFLLCGERKLSLAGQEGKFLSLVPGIKLRLQPQISLFKGITFTFTKAKSGGGNILILVSFMSQVLSCSVSFVGFYRNEMLDPDGPTHRIHFNSILRILTFNDVYPIILLLLLLLLRNPIFNLLHLHHITLALV